jgi:hypothetical protein
MASMSDRRLAVAAMLAAIRLTGIGWLTSDRGYQRDQLVGYLIGLGTTAIPALTGWGLLRTLKGRAPSAAPDTALFLVVRCFLFIGVVFFVGLVLFSRYDTPRGLTTACSDAQVLRRRRHCRAR